MNKLHVRQPTLRNGQWCVIIADGPGPLSKELEAIPCGGREAAFQTFRRVKKEQGKML